MLKVAQVAQRLNCSISTVYDLIESGRLGHHRCPGIRVSEEQLAAYLKATERARLPAPPRRQQTRARLRHIRLK